MLSDDNDLCFSRHKPIALWRVKTRVHRIVITRLTRAMARSLAGGGGFNRYLSRKPRVMERCGEWHSIASKKSSQRHFGYFRSGHYRGHQRSSNVKFGEIPILRICVIITETITCKSLQKKRSIALELLFCCSFAKAQSEFTRLPWIRLLEAKKG